MSDPIPSPPPLEVSAETPAAAPAASPPPQAPVDQFSSDPVKQNLLNLVARGHATIAEMRRLSDHIPSVFKLETKEDIQKYQYIIVDFRYLRQTDLWDQRVDSNIDLLDLMEEFRETHLDLLARFYALFESIYNYGKDLVMFCEQLKDGIYVSHTVETVLNDFDARQLFIESIQLCGVMLLLMDTTIEGPVRERLLIAYYRAKGPVELVDVDQICALCRSTGFNPSLGWTKRPEKYPEDFFGRVGVPKDLVHLMLGRLRNEDIYLQLQFYPSPEQRPTALAQMASICFIILFFIPDVLYSQPSTMNELVNRFFSDNWVISYYMGQRVDLLQVWEPYKAAKQAMNTVITPLLIQQTIEFRKHSYDQVMKEVNGYLSEGLMTEDYVVDHMVQILTTLRNSNCTLRWIMLHLTTSYKKFAEMLRPVFSKDDVLALMIQTAQLELILKKLYQNLLSTKQDRWDKLKTSSTQIITEIAEFFAGGTGTTKISKNEELEKWFREINTQIASVDYREPNSAGRKTAKLIAALEEVEQFQQIEQSLQIRQFLSDVRQNLTLMIRTINCREETMINIQVVSDMSYAWETAAEYIALMQHSIKQQASIVSKLRATFLKLSTMLEFPLMRIMQANSPDKESVAEYYSNRLVSFVRSVLQVVPITLFELMGQIIKLTTTELRDFPPKFAKEAMRDLAQLPLRTRLAKLTHEVVSFTDGILEMEKTNMGVIEVNPKVVLEEGVRKELVQKMSLILHTTLQFPTHKVGEFEDRLKSAALQMAGLRASFEYIQDYVGLYGLKIWQEEMQRLSNFYLEQECNTFLKKRVFEWQSEFQNEAAPIPLFPPTDSISTTFIGRLTRELIELTSPSHCVYSFRHTAWMDRQTRDEVVGVRLFTLLYNAVDVSLMAVMDRLLSFMIASTLSRTTLILKREIDRSMGLNVLNLASAAAPPGCVPDSNRILNSVAQTFKLVPRVCATLIDCILRIGHLQLLRCHLQSRLRAACKLESSVLCETLETLNEALLLDVEQHYRKPDTNAMPSAESPILPELSRYLQMVGQSNPLSQVYVATEPIASIDFLVFVGIVDVLGRMQIDTSLGNILVARNIKDPLDGVPLAVGAATFLKQFHSSFSTSFIERYGQLVRALYTEYGRNALKETEISAKTKIPSLSPEIQNLTRFVMELKKYMVLPDDAFDTCVPRHIVESF